MPDSLSFMDCPHCGKRIRSDAVLCHHCKQAPRARGRAKGSERRLRHYEEISDAGDELSEGEGAGSALSDAGYSADDFDYDEFIEEEFGSDSENGKNSIRPHGVKSWVWITACILIIATLLPILYALALTP